VKRRSRGKRRKYRAKGGGEEEREGGIRKREGRKNFQVRHPHCVEMLKL
jgi:hypothetical protein